MFSNCQVITGATLHYIFIICIQNHLLCFRLLSYNKHMAVQPSFLLKRSMDLKTSVGCPASGSHCPCTPCVQHFSGPGSHRLSSFSSRPKPSCGTCCCGRSPICCGMVMAERQKGHLSPGNWWQQPCCPFWGWPWRSPHSHYCLCHCWACHLRLQWTSWRQV